MQKIFFTFLLMLAVIYTQAQIQNTTSSLNAVTVYSNGAELSHTAKANIPSGNSELVIKNIATSLDENSIQVGSNGDLTIMSVSFRREYLGNRPKSSVLIKLEDSLKYANNELEIIKSQIATQRNAVSILDANKVVRGENTGLNVLELQKMVDYYILKHKEITIAVQSLIAKETKQQEIINKLNSQIAEMRTGEEYGTGEIVLQILNTNAAAVTFNISYVSYTAAWSPVYDLKTKDTKSALKIIYKGNIVQNTGLDWNKIKLSLSTSNPSQSGTAPILSTWFLDYYQANYGYKNKAQGYGNYQQSAPMLNSIQSLSTETTDKIEVAKTVSDFTNVNETALNAIFDIDLAYDIPSDNKAHSVSMKEYEVAAQYKYYCVPKMDKDAFLLAEVSDWESLNLVPGPANIIFDGTYVGKSFIDPNSTQDTLNLSLGRDRKIIVKREKVQDFCSAKMIGSNKLHTVTYEIKVKNTRKEAIGMLLKDQFPISTNKDIVVELLQSDNAEQNLETGVLTWRLNIAPGETQKVRISYSVKYPKDKNVGVLYK
jgi:uncharacterized protein (TIGR02231 family)